MASLTLPSLGLSCGPTPGPAVKVAVVAPFSGPAYLSGFRLLFAVRQAVREWNRAGGVAGRRVELIALDDRGEAAAGALQARAVARDPAVVGVIGHPDRASATAAQAVYREAGIPAFLSGPADSPTEISSIFPLHPPMAALGQAIASWARDPLAAQRIAVVSGHGLTVTALPPLLQTLERAGVQADTLPLPAAPEESGFLRDLMAVRPDLVLFSGPAEEGARLARLLGRGGFSRPLLLMPEAAQPRFLQLAAGDADGVYYIALAPAPQDTPEGRPFHASYRELALSSAHNVEPGADGALAYDATYLLLTATARVLQQQGHLDRSTIGQAIREGEEWLGVVGPLSFAATGRRPPIPLLLYRITGLAYPGTQVATALIYPPSAFSRASP